MPRLVSGYLSRLRLVLGEPEAAPSVVVPFSRDQIAGCIRYADRSRVARDRVRWDEVVRSPTPLKSLQLLHDSARKRDELACLVAAHSHRVQSPVDRLIP